MDGRDNNFGIDFAPIGQAIKKARIAQNMTREQLAGIIEYSIRHVQSIENEGQFPSIQLFIYLVRMFHISLDEFIFADEKVEKTSQRRQLDTLLDKLDDSRIHFLNHIRRISADKDIREFRHTLCVGHGIFVNRQAA